MVNEWLIMISESIKHLQKKHGEAKTAECQRCSNLAPAWGFETETETEVFKG